MWFIKLVGSVLLVASTFGIGVYAVNSLKKRAEALGFYSKLAGSVALQINSTAAELYDIVNTVYGCRDYLELSRPFKVRLKPCELSASEQKTVEEFFEGLGMGELEAQVKRCEGYAALFAEQYREALGEYREKSKLYKMLGLFSGLVIAIILV